MSDRPDKPSDKTNDGDSSRLAPTVQNQVFDEMIAQSQASGKWGQSGQKPETSAADSATALAASKAQEEIARPPTNSLLTAASREIDDLAFGKKNTAADNAAHSISDQARALGLDIGKNPGQDISRVANAAGDGKSNENPNIINIPIPIEFIQDGLRALQERAIMRSMITESQQVNTEVQRRSQIETNALQETKEKQQPTEAKNTESQRTLPSDVAANQEIKVDRPAEGGVRDAVTTTNEARAEAVANQRAEQRQEINQQTDLTAARVNDQAAGRVTDQAAGRINDQAAARTDATRLPQEVNVPTDLIGGAAARGTTDSGAARTESDQTRGAVRDSSRAAADALVAALDARIAQQVSSDAQVRASQDVSNEVPADKGKETSGEENPVAKLGKAIADFARRVLSTLMGDAGSSKDRSIEKEETGDKSEGGDGGDGTETTETEETEETEEERQKKKQEDKRPSYIVMDGDYLELVAMKLYSTTGFTTLLKRLNPKLSINRQYLGVLGTEVDMLKVGEEIFLPTQSEIEDYLRTLG